MRKNADNYFPKKVSCLSDSVISHSNHMRHHFVFWAFNTWSVRHSDLFLKISFGNLQGSASLKLSVTEGFTITRILGLNMAKVQVGNPIFFATGA